MELILVVFLVLLTARLYPERVAQTLRRVADELDGPGKGGGA